MLCSGNAAWALSSFTTVCLSLVEVALGVAAQAEVEEHADAVGGVELRVVVDLEEHAFGGGVVAGGDVLAAEGELVVPQQLVSGHLITCHRVVVGSLASAGKIM